MVRMPISPRTETIALTTASATPLLLTVWNATTLLLNCTGDLTGFDVLKAELHNLTGVGGMPLAEVEYEDTPGTGPHLLTFTAAQMNQLTSKQDGKLFYLVILGRTGSGASIVKTVLRLIRLTLSAAPAGDTAANPPAVSGYVTQEDFAALLARVEALEEGGGGGGGGEDFTVTISGDNIATITDSDDNDWNYGPVSSGGPGSSGGEGTFEIVEGIIYYTDTDDANWNFGAASAGGPGSSGGVGTFEVVQGILYYTDTDGDWIFGPVTAV